MINVQAEEVEQAATNLNVTVDHFKDKYIEQSESGRMIINTIPCHFLEDKICTIYENRFNACRDFPYLNQPKFTERLFATLMHYSICPIIYNVIEQLKIETQFLNTPQL
jgi:hypothetical protein